jgi:hypothetical protein
MKTLTRYLALAAMVALGRASSDQWQGAPSTSTEPAVVAAVAQAWASQGFRDGEICDIPGQAPECSPACR